MVRPAISYDDMQRIASDGSPMLVQAFGRALGLGPSERAALAGDGAGAVPGIVWVALGLAVGVAVGARIERRWPGAMPGLVAGGDR